MKSLALSLGAAVAVTTQQALALPSAAKSDSSESNLLKRATDYSEIYPQCNSTIRERKPWTWLTDDEKTNYLNAELCLMETDSKLDLSTKKINQTTQTRWDDLQYTHIHLTNYIHSTGQFLPFHRHFLHTHEKMLRDDCDYDGPMPYWNETAESDDIWSSVLLTSDAFGGQSDTASGDDGDQYCVEDGYFANTTLRMHRIGEEQTDYCLYRNFDQSWMDYASNGYIDECLAEDNYPDFWDCLSLYPHGAGHEAVGGVMGDVAISPGDPLFFLHHGWIDAIWWKWQMLDPDNRLYAMGGQNYMSDSTLEQIDMPRPPKFVFDENGDNGNITTLNHTLWNYLVDNTTVGAVMDIRSEVICSNYTFGDW